MSLKDWSVTAASNTSAPPNGAPEGMTVANLNNTMRQIMADVRTLAAEDTIASATTCDLGTKDATFLTITGTTTITGFGTVSAGIYKFVKFSGALTLTHNATSLILLTGANRTTVAGDVGLYKSEGSGNWREYFYSGQTSYQPLDTDLTAIAALTTTAFGRGLLELADAAALRTSVGAASETATGVVELATSAETVTGTDTARAVTPAGAAAAYVAQKTANVTPLPSAGAGVSAAHTLAAIPSLVTLELVCLVAENGYGVGAVAEATGEWSGAGTASPLSIWKTTTDVGFKMTAGEGLFLRNVSTGAAFFPTAANWAYRFVLRR